MFVINDFDPKAVKYLRVLVKIMNLTSLSVLGKVFGYEIAMKVTNIYLSVDENHARLMVISIF